MQRRVSGALRDSRLGEVVGLATASHVGGLVEGVVAVDEGSELAGLDEAVDGEAGVCPRRWKLKLKLGSK